MKSFFTDFEPVKTLKPKSAAEVQEIIKKANKDKTPLTEDDNVIYGGCYVNAIIELWAQDNNYGKRINANLLGVQFHKDGEPFGGGGVSVKADDFDDVSGDDDDFDF